VGDAVWPIRGLTSSMHAMPTLAERFKTFHDFAVARLDEIYTPESLQHSLKLEVNELRSGLLLNDGAGRFEFRPLPALAQSAPSFGVSFCHADGDGNVDLYLVQNSYGPHRETGRMDGGLSVLLLGDGAGEFTPVWPNRSGLVVPHDAKGLARLDLDADGADDFLVSINGDGFRTFRATADGARHLQVRLQGPLGNPTAVGAKVAVVSSTGGRSVRQVAEVYAGGSYLSQSSPRVSLPVSDGKATEVHVRWPDGTEERTTLGSDVASIVELIHAQAK
jgi:hypothetical protein